MRDNFDRVEEFVKDLKPGQYMFLMIVVRKKDHEYEEVKEKCIKTYFISSWDEFVNLHDEIVTLCETFGARAYINLNVKNYDDLQKSLMCLVAENIQYNRQINTKTLLAKANSKTRCVVKRWLIDIDAEHVDDAGKVVMDALDMVGIGLTYDEFVYQRIPSKSGYHYITRPFSYVAFKEKWPDIDVHKNDGGVLLYMP